MASGVLILELDPTVWLDGARPANTCIRPPSLGSSGEIDHLATPLGFHALEPWWPRWCLHHLGGESLKPDPREGGRVTGVGRSSSI